MGQNCQPTENSFGNDYPIIGSEKVAHLTRLTRWWVRKKLVRKNVLECKQLPSNNDMQTKKEENKNESRP